MEKDDLYLVLAKIKLLIKEYDKDNKDATDSSKVEKIMKELRIVLKDVNIPSKYLIAEGFDSLYKEVKK